MFRALTENPRERAIWEFRQSRGGAFDGEQGLDLAIVRSSARSQEHLTNSLAKKKNKSRQQHRTSLRSLHRCSKNLNTKVAWERLSFTMCTACLFSESLQNKPEPVFEPRSNLASTFPAQERRRCQLGKLCLVPGVDFMNYTFAGNALPRKAEHDNVCRLCARVGVKDNEDSSATVSSSSFSEVP